MRPAPGPRACPICGGGRKSVFFRQMFSGPDSASFLSGYDVAVCDDCGFGFADRIPMQVEFDQYYRDSSKYENDNRAGEASPEDLDRFRKIADLVERFLPSRQARILEIGCSTGGLLAVLRGDGFPNVEGIDPAPACASAAGRLHGIRVRTGSLADLPVAAERFDMVILVGVLEHVVELRRTMEMIRELCAPSGQVYVEVPDALHFADCMDAPYQQFSTEHVAYFSDRSLRNLAEGTGFRTLSCTQTVRAHTSTSRMPVLCGVFVASGDSLAPVRDGETLAGLASYVERSACREARLARAVEELAASGEPVFVWGFGTLTRRLLATSPLGRANIRAFVDSNPHYRGLKVQGVEVIGPRELLERSEADSIVIASWVFQDEIERQIREELGLRNDLIRLSTGDRVTLASEPRQAGL